MKKMVLRQSLTGVGILGAVLFILPPPAIYIYVVFVFQDVAERTARSLPYRGPWISLPLIALLGALPLLGAVLLLVGREFRFAEAPPPDPPRKGETRPPIRHH